MDFEIRDPDIDHLYNENKGHEKYQTGVGKIVRRRIQTISGVPNERELYKFAGIRFEKLSGDRSHQRSMRINKQWRLIVEIEEREEGNKMIVVGIEDYH
tara:strand:+ start:651 stop:947 length:297 start_codon:yes stop_codon:yes gene_type:complete